MLVPVKGREHDLRRLTITVCQGKRCKERITDKVDKLLAAIQEFSDETRSMARSEGEHDQPTAPLPHKDDNIYMWEGGDTYVRRMTTVVGWIDDLFARVRGEPTTNKYEAICTCRQVCRITALGMRVLETDGQLHYECEEDIKLVLEDYLD